MNFPARPITGKIGLTLAASLLAATALLPPAATAQHRRLAAPTKPLPHPAKTAGCMSASATPAPRTKPYA